MESKSYIINSPNFPVLKDFENFNIWCEWSDPEEVEYIKSLCSSNEEYENKIIVPYKKGKETYYPIIKSNHLPERNHLHVYVETIIAKKIQLKGFISLVDNLITSLTIWLPGEKDNEVTLYSSDRLVAEDENPESLKEIKKQLNLSNTPQLRYRSTCKLSNDKVFEGVFEC